MSFQTNEEDYREEVSVVLNLESLNAQYRNLLIEYRQAVSNYVNFLKQYVKTDTNVDKISWCKPLVAAGWCTTYVPRKDILSACAKSCNAPKEQEMVTIKDASYWGTESVGQNNSATIQECSASCATNSKCTGATFNANANGQTTCWLRGGDTDITGGSQGDYAIVPKGKQLLLIVQKLNQQLSDANQRIQTLTESGEDIYNTQVQQRNESNSNLIRQYVQLSRERERINETITDYQTLDQQQTEGNLVVNQNYYSFILLFILAVATIIALYMFGAASSESSGDGSESSIMSYAMIGLILVVVMYAWKFYSS
jgi:NADH:ubiquinone oxidoreductase subunit 3 (subunit A)